MTRATADRAKSFAHGIHPPEHKHTAGQAIERMGFADELVLPLSQHIGAPSVPIVRVGQEVVRGQRIADPGGFVSVALHAPATGRVTAIERRPHPNGQLMEAIVIAPDPFASQRILAGEPVDYTSLSNDALVAHIQQAGLVGLGGAAFPSHVKVAVPAGKRVTTVVINGCECEPYLTSDHRLMVERPEAIVRAVGILMASVGAERGYIGVEVNKLDAIEALRAVGAVGIEVVPLAVKYPQGAEKQLIKAIFDREIRPGGLPLDLEMLVNNVGTMVAMADLFDLGHPLVDRVVTVTGPAIAQPRNLLIPLGTSLRAVIAHCGGLTTAAAQVILGGPMMGMAQNSLDVPVVKGTSGILCLAASELGGRVEHACIRCGRCVEACPMFLNPAQLVRFARHERTEELEANHLLACYECASCSYTCPSGIPLVHYLRMGKAMVRAAKRRAAERAKLEAGAT